MTMTRNCESQIPEGKNTFLCIKDNKKQHFISQPPPYVVHKHITNCKEVRAHVNLVSLSKYLLLLLFEANAVDTHSSANVCMIMFQTE